MVEQDWDVNFQNLLDYGHSHESHNVPFTEKEFGLNPETRLGYWLHCQQQLHCLHRLREER